MSGFDNTSFTVRTTAATTDTLTATDYVVIYTATSAKATTVPSGALVVPGRKYEIINTAAGAVTLTPAAGTINGAANLAVTASTGRAVIVNDGTNWFTISVV
jgi:hypothetical protein